MRLVAFHHVRERALELPTAHFDPAAHPAWWAKPLPQARALHDRRELRLMLVDGVDVVHDDRADRGDPMHEHNGDGLTEPVRTFSSFADLLERLIRATEQRERRRQVRAHG